MKGRRPTVLFVEDENYIRAEFSRILVQEGYEVIDTDKPDVAIGRMEETPQIDLLIADVQMSIEDSKYLSNMRTQGGKLAGLEVARHFRRYYPSAPILFWTYSYDRGLRIAIRKMGNAHLVSKRVEADFLLDLIAEALEGYKGGQRPRAFIVHGHDEPSLGELISFLKEDLGFPAPVVLRERASSAQTLIERVEDEGLNVDVVFVLLTPDDKVVTEDGLGFVFRARQNVLLELGFFLGLLGRGTGRVILLHKQPVELPSDLGGVVTVDITNGVRGQEAMLRDALSEWTAH